MGIWDIEGPWPTGLPGPTPRLFDLLPSVPHPGLKKPPVHPVPRRRFSFEPEPTILDVFKGLAAPIQRALRGVDPRVGEAPPWIRRFIPEPQPPRNVVGRVTEIGAGFLGAPPPPTRLSEATGLTGLGMAALPLALPGFLGPMLRQGAITGRGAAVEQAARGAAKQAVPVAKRIAVGEAGGARLPRKPPVPKGAPLEGMPAVQAGEAGVLTDKSGRVTYDSVQTALDDMTDRLMAQGKTFLEADSAPEMEALYRVRFLIEEKEFTQFYSNLTKNLPKDISKSGLKEVLDFVYSIKPTPEARTHFAAKFVARPFASASAETEALKDASQKLLRDWAFHQNLDPEGIFGPMSGYTALGQKRLLEKFANQAKAIHNAIRNALGDTMPIDISIDEAQKVIAQSRGNLQVVSKAGAPAVAQLTTAVPAVQPEGAGVRPPSPAPVTEAAAAGGLPPQGPPRRRGAAGGPPTGGGQPPIGKPPTGGGLPAPLDPKAVVAEWTEQIRAAKKLRGPTAEAISKERSRRRAIIQAQLQAKRGAEARRAAFGAAKGEIPTPEFEPASAVFTTEKAEMLQEMIRARFENDAYRYLPAQTAFDKLFSGGRIPSASELAVLEEVFGSDFVQAVLTQRKTGTKVWELLLELWNVPKALKASYDLSGTLRQGAYVLLEGNPAKQAFVAELKAVRSEAGFQAVNEAIAANKWYDFSQGLGKNSLDLTLPRVARGLVGREEPYIGARLASRIPLIGRGVRISERAYTAFLNKIRMETFAKEAEALSAKGAPREAYEKLAWNINVLSGRGSLGKFQQASAIFNLPFFSPRFAVSRFQIPLTFATRNPQLLRMALRDVVGYISTIFAVEAMLDLSGVADIEWDPRSSDFGKIRIGRRRLDPFAGFQQPVVLVTQLLSGQRKQLDSGRMVDIDPMQRVGQFLETKLGPSASLTLALKKGQLYAGKALTAGSALYELLMPIPITDIWEAARDSTSLAESIIMGTAGGVLGGLGLGIQTFEADVGDLRKQVAQEMGFADYEAASREAKQQIDADPRVRKVIEHTMSERTKTRLTQETGLGEQVRARGGFWTKEARDEYSRIQRDYLVTQPEFTQGKPKNDNEKALQEYYQAFKTAQSATGGLDDDMLQAELTRYESQWTPEQRKYVEDNTETKLHDDPDVRAYVEFNRKLREEHYWDLHKVVPFFQQKPAVVELYELYVKARRDDKVDAFYQEHGQSGRQVILRAEAEIERVRTNMRTLAPWLDEGLVRFYGRKGQTPQGRILESKRERTPFSAIMDRDYWIALQKRDVTTLAQLANWPTMQLRTLRNKAGYPDAKGRWHYPSEKTVQSWIQQAKEMMAVQGEGLRQAQ